MTLFRSALTLVLAMSLGGQGATAASPNPVGAEHGMVVSAHRLASDAGVDILRGGGNAVDAAIAVAYALAVTFPEAGNIGGGGFMTIRLRNGRQTFIDFRETAPRAATPDMYLDAAGNVVPGLSTRGYRAVAVPGTVAGLELARTKYGTRPRAALMAASIRLARDGFTLDQGDASFLNEGGADFAKDAPSAAIFLRGGQPWQKGDRLVQTDLSRMLQAISDKGADAFYKGKIANLIVAASTARGGILTLRDFADYKAVEREPTECDYRGYHIVSAPLPSSGGVVICETLNILAGYPMKDLGFNSAQGAHFMAEALRRAFHDRNVNLGDPGFVTADVTRLISPDYAAQLRLGIAADKATPSASLGIPGANKEGSSTTHFSIVDANGNAVSVTYTLNDWFGARVTPAGTGILLNDEMDDFSAKPGVPNMFGLVEGVNNAIAPGKRPLSSMSPTIVTKDGKLVMVLGTPGGSHIPTGVLQVIFNVIDHGMTIAEAVNAPRIHAQWLPDVLYYETDALSADTKASLVARGHKLEPMGYENQIAAILIGAPAIAKAPIGRDVLYGAIDPRLPVGSVAGY
jgi:gamma-glutamyltranspeptidase / glutathione hydrolase